MRTRGLLSLLGTDRGTLHRYAVALEQSPRVTRRQGHPYDWSPGACATIYTSYLLCHDSNLGPAQVAGPVTMVGAEYDATWTVSPARVPEWAAFSNGTVYTAHTAAEVWKAAQPSGRVVRIVSLVALKEALMTEPHTKPVAYVVTVGLTRRLIHAVSADEAKATFIREVAAPRAMRVDDTELLVRHANADDLDEFLNEARR